MTPETKAYLDKAAENLADARMILAIPLAKVAARSVYYVGFHATEALLMARTGRIAKTHGGGAPPSPNSCPTLPPTTGKL